MKSSGWTDGFLSAVHFWNRSAVPQPWLPFYLIFPMTDCTLFKLPVTFPLRELLHFEILIKAEPPVTSWFPPIAEAAANIKEEGVPSLSWGRGVKLDNRLFDCGTLISWPQHEAKRMLALHIRPPMTQQRPRTRKSHNRHFIVMRPPKTISWHYRCFSLTNNLMTTLNVLGQGFMHMGTHQLLKPTIVHRFQC